MTGRKEKSRRGQRRHIALKDGDAIARMKRAGQVVALVLDRLAESARPGVTTGELDRLAEAVIRSFGAIPTFYGLYDYPANICASVNDEVVHGIPGDRRLQEGDIISFDVGATVEDMIADAATSVGVGDISQDAKRLLQVTREALHKGIEQARPGNRVADISAAIQNHAESHGCGVVRKLVGHGVGYTMHEPPQIPNFVDDATADSPELVPGMTLAIEPMINQGTWQVTQDDDGWTYRTRDGSLSAHFEHTIAITEEGCEILTLRTAAGRSEVLPDNRPEALAQRAPAGGQL